MADTARYLVSDIGGTNIRLATFATDPRQREDVVTYKLDPRTGKPWHVDDAFADYIAKYPHTYAAACLGVAGRVRDRAVQITNRPDLVRRDDVAALLKIDNPKRVLLVNDMPPHLACVDRLSPGEVVDVKAGGGDPDDCRAVLMPGTGVGTGGAIPIGGGRHRVFPSEGGHVDFAPRDAQQEALLEFLHPLAAAVGHANVSNEFVFAGEGLRRIYTFLRDPSATTTDGAPKAEEITTTTAAADLPPDHPCRQAVELYVKLVAAAAGNLALMFAATGGVYLGGSILLALRKYLPTPLFADAFLDSGPPQHRPFMEEVPVRLIDYKDSGLLGSGVLALGLGG
jgi:glucokinase